MFFGFNVEDEEGTLMKRLFAAAACAACVSLLTVAPASNAQSTKDHKVVKGDTLWDLSDGYLTDPLLWPKIWKVNPDIANPHWILPGQIVKIPLLGDDFSGIAAGEAAGAAAQVPMVTVDMSKAPPPLRVVGKKDIGPADDSGIDDRVAKAYDRGIGIVTFDIPGDGKVLQTNEGWQVTGVQTTIAIDAPGATVGQRFGVYRDLGKVKHPEKWGSPGHLVADVGIVEVAMNETGTLYGKIVRAFTEVKNGDLLGPVPPVPVIKEGAPKGNIPVKGTVIALHLMRQLAGADDIVYVDLGDQDGITLGDRLFISGSDKEDDRRNAGEVMVLRITGTTAAALVTGRSDHEIVPGDRVGLIL